MRDLAKKNKPDGAEDVVKKLVKALNDPKTFEDKTPFADMLLRGMESREQGLEREISEERPGLSKEMIERIKKLGQSQREALLAMTLESLRGYWGDHEERLAMVHWLCDHIYDDTEDLHRIHFPEELLDAIRHNAYLFDGEWTDGRIFRDGDRGGGLTGNLMYRLTGDDRIQQKGGWGGTYYEAWRFCASRGGSSLIFCMKNAYHEVLRFTSDCTFDDDFPLTEERPCSVCKKVRKCQWTEDPYFVLDDTSHKRWLCDECYLKRDIQGGKVSE